MTRFYKTFKYVSSVVIMPESAEAPACCARGFGHKPILNFLFASCSSQLSNANTHEIKHDIYPK